MNKILKFILENAPAYKVQEAVKQFSISGLPYKMKQSIINEFPEYRHAGCTFGVALSEALEEFKTDSILLLDINYKIVQIQHQMKMFGKYHPKYKGLVEEHDMLVIINNELNAPINKFLKLYKKVQKAKGKAISVVKKKETKFQVPA